VTHAVTESYALGTFARDGGTPFPGLVVGERVLDLTTAGYAAGTTTRDLLGDWDATLRRCDTLAGSVARDGEEVTGLTVLAPIEPGLVLQAGANYRKHVVDIVVSERRAEPGVTEDEVRAGAEAMMDARAATGTPYVFLGSPRAICGPYDDVVLPLEGDEPDWELELAVVIGATARRVAVGDAMALVAAYTICNDLTTRDRVYRPDLTKIGTDWFVSKNPPTFLPTGPYLVPARFVPDPSDLRVTLRHNGVVRQDESTSDMIFDIARLVSYASTVTELRPGDLLLTGSPAGNGAHWRVFLAPGDLLEGTVTGLGEQRNRVVAEQASSCPPR
jgi:2-keto-4-pentenoate hydratase/2-oxohepta-3-ene-1,7-dioic acid hydratase in catechol pathway